MTAWLLPENKAALYSVLPHAGWSRPDEPGRPRLTMHAPDGNGWGWSIFVHSDIKYGCSARLNVSDLEAECRLNMAAMEWLKRNTPTLSLTLWMDIDRSVTEQIIKVVRTDVRLMRKGTRP